MKYGDPLTHIRDRNKLITWKSAGELEICISVNSVFGSVEVSCGVIRCYGYVEIQQKMFDHEISLLKYIQYVFKGSSCLKKGKTCSLHDKAFPGSTTVGHWSATFPCMCAHFGFFSAKPCCITWSSVVRVIFSLIHVATTCPCTITPLCILRRFSPFAHASDTCYMFHLCELNVTLSLGYVAEACLYKVHLRRSRRDFSPAKWLPRRTAKYSCVYRCSVSLWLCNGTSCPSSRWPWK